VTIAEPHALVKLVEFVPEFRDRYPMTLIVDGFANLVQDAVRAENDDLVSRGLDFVEELAQSDDPRAQNLVIVCFLEAAMWGELGVFPRFGPATQRLVREADPRMIDPTML
jgi:hypothetical protein